jgi:hypothetical protein
MNIEELHEEISNSKPIGCWLTGADYEAETIDMFARMRDGRKIVARFNRKQSFVSLYVEEMGQLQHKEWYKTPAEIMLSLFGYFNALPIDVDEFDGDERFDAMEDYIEEAYKKVGIRK